MLFGETSVTPTPVVRHVRQTGALGCVAVCAATVILAAQTYPVAAQEADGQTDRVTFAFASIARLKRDCEVRPDSEAKFVSRANIEVQKLAQEFKVGFVIQDAVYASMRTDMTPYLLSALGCKSTVASPNPRSDAGFPAQAGKVGYIDMERILREAPPTRAKWEALPEDVRAKGVQFAMANSSFGAEVRSAVPQLNIYLREFATSGEYVLILQEAVWVDEKNNVTSAFLKFLGKRE